MYGSVESEKPLATECVTSTRGEIAIADGQPIRANYCSTCGGITADVWEAWPASGLSVPEEPPRRREVGRVLRGLPAIPLERGVDRFGLRAHDRALRAGRGVAIPRGGLGDLIDVRVAARSRSGRVWRLVVTTARAEVTIPAYSLRRVVRRPGESGAILRSNLFKIDVRRDPRTRRALWRWWRTGRAPGTASACARPGRSGWQAREPKARPSSSTTTRAFGSSGSIESRDFRARNR